MSSISSFSSVLVDFPVELFKRLSRRFLFSGLLAWSPVLVTSFWELSVSSPCSNPAKISAASSVDCSAIPFTGAVIVASFIEFKGFTFTPFNKFNSDVKALGAF